MNLEAKIIKPKLGLLELSRQLGSVTQACKGYLYLFKDKLRYGWQKKEYRSIYSYEQYWRRTC